MLALTLNPALIFLSEELSDFSHNPFKFRRVISFVRKLASPILFFFKTLDLSLV
jgi:hypothetical protein